MGHPLGTPFVAALASMGALGLTRGWTNALVQTLPVMSGSAQHARAHLALVGVPCCVCGVDAGEPIAVGEDFEYRTSPDTFQAVR
jgi:hypothetical protein